MSKAQYYADQAALLDPDCYVYQKGASWSLTVPAGKTWYMLNGWSLRKPSSPWQDYRWHHRDLDVRDAFMMSTGFSFMAASYNAGYAYYADPSIVQASDNLGPGGTNRYATDPEALYYERIERLKTLPVETVGVYIAPHTSGGVNNFNAFPGDCERLILRHVDCHDGCWVILQSGNYGDNFPAVNAMNTLDEINDSYPQRLTRSILCPIRRSDFPKVRLGVGSMAYNGLQTDDGWGSVHFSRLPSDW